MYQRKILFMVAVGGLLAQASKTTLKNNVLSSFVNNGPRQERGINSNRTKETPQSVPVAYLFSTSVSDPSRGFFQSRTESRSQNGQVKGEYSYMDGFYKVKVVYSAGPKGFRVIRKKPAERFCLNILNRELLPSEMQRHNIYFRSNRVQVPYYCLNTEWNGKTQH